MRAHFPEATCVQAACAMQRKKPCLNRLTAPRQRNRSLLIAPDSCMIESEIMRTLTNIIYVLMASICLLIHVQ